MKITPKPIAPSDIVRKSRDISGVRKWSRESRIVGSFMAFLGWFTIPAEVFLHRKFGRRWFTPMNFYAGGFLLILLAFIQYLLDKSRYWVSRVESMWNPFHEASAVPDYSITNDMIFFVMLYTVLGGLHLFRIWWRNKTNAEIHSYDDGTPWLEPVGGFLMKIINVIAIPFIDGYMQSLSAK